ncbi:MAG: TM2 domain-containing protein [Cyanobacteria bacterium]|nr:TM2 domain-containing protein [Cyanobacteriota bacterium]
MTLRPFPSSLSALAAGAERRSIAVSYLLWCISLVGVCGLQRFYNRRPISGTIWLLTFGLCFVGQMVDLLLIPDLVQRANQPLRLQEALDAATTSSLPPLERQLLQLARRSGRLGFTINDALLELQLPRDADSEVVSAEIERLLHRQLLDVGNDERGRVVYREP